MLDALEKPPSSAEPVKVGVHFLLYVECDVGVDRDGRSDSIPCDRGQGPSVQCAQVQRKRYEGL